jgi:hypothetical protein
VHRMLPGGRPIVTVRPALMPYHDTAEAAEFLLDYNPINPPG